MPSILKVKEKISQKFMGAANIVAIGLTGLDDDAVILVCAKDLESADFKDALKEIENEASPFTVKTRQMSPAKFL